jgi:hypothetical protein
LTSPPPPLSESEKEKFYDFYLQLHIRGPKLDDPGDWLMSLKLGSIHAELPLSLREQPLQFFAGLSTDLDIAQRCLESFIAATRIGRSKDEQRKAYNSAPFKPGSTALAWLLENYETADLSVHLGFLKSLIHCLVAEGGEKQIWTWLEIPHTPTVLSTQPLMEKVAWRGAVLRFLVESQAYWSGNINDSLESFEHAWSITMPYQIGHEAEREPLSMSKALGGTWITMHLLYKSDLYMPSAELFDQFVERLPFWVLSPAQCELNHVDLRRVHPSMPSAQPSFEFIRWYRDHRPSDPWLQNLLKSAAGFFWIVRTAKQLARAGDHLRAREALELGRELMPHHFQMDNRRHKHYGLDYEARTGKKGREGARWVSRRAYIQKFSGSK